MRGEAASTLADLASLLRSLNDLKRVRAAHFSGSFADQLFVDAWSQLLAGRPAGDVALDVTARAVAATRLAAIDANVLRDHGLDDAEATAALTAAFDEAAAGIDATLRDALRSALGNHPSTITADVPDFVASQLRQPRAGATHPGKPRMILEPAESHGDHCLLVAVYATLVSPRFGADAGDAFLCGLAHHLFNASLPDAGFDGDVALDRAGVLDRVVAAAFGKAYAELDARTPALGQRVRVALAFTRQTEPAVSRCFHAADVFDRVLEMAWFDRAASFTLSHAVRDLDIVHVAPERSFQRAALTEAGLWTEWPGG